MNSQLGTPAPIFKKCTCCGHEWSSRADFLSDPQIVIVGYQADFDSLRHGLFLFNHLACGTTMALQAKTLADLYLGPRYKGQMTGTSQCAGLCLAKENLEVCPASCEGAQFREIIQIVKNWAKVQPPTP